MTGQTEGLVLEGIPAGNEIEKQNPLPVTIRIFDDEFSGRLLYEEHQKITRTHPQIHFVFEKGSIGVRHSTTGMDTGKLWIEVEIAGSRLSPRLNLTDVGTTTDLTGEQVSLRAAGLRSEAAAMLQIDAQGISLGGELNMGSQALRLGNVARTSWPSGGIVSWSDITDIPPGFADGTDDGGSRNSLDAADGEPAEALFVDSQGNVGIGTHHPLGRLEVSGDLKISGLGHSLVFPDGSRQSHAVAAGGFSLPVDESGTETSRALFAIKNIDGNTAVKGEVLNQNSTQAGCGVRGTAYCPYAAATGVYGWAGGSNKANSYGVYGEVGSLIPGQHVRGCGVFGKNTDHDTWGFVGGDAAGAQGNYAFSGGSSNYGQLGTYKYGVYGYHTGGNRGYLGGAYHALYGESLNGEALYAIARGKGDAALHAVAAGGGFAGIFEGTVRITGGSDFSEPFPVHGGTKQERPQQGMIVSIDPAVPGRLVISRTAYDRKVAGIISGAGGINPGMVMGQPGTLASGKVPVALSGRVYCKADAAYGAISPGDLLTTSNTPGHAMRVTDYTRAHGAVLGKAMSGLQNGRGLVLVLVSLQ